MAIILASKSPRRQELMRERFEHMLAYAANETRCRSAVLEGYFGEGAPAACGVCDICLAHKRAGKRQAQGCATPSGCAKNCGKGYPAGQPTRTNWPRNSPGRHSR